MKRSKYFYRAFEGCANRNEGAEQIQRNSPAKVNSCLCLDSVLLIRGAGAGGAWARQDIPSIIRPQLQGLAGEDPIPAWGCYCCFMAKALLSHTKHSTQVSLNLPSFVFASIWPFKPWLQSLCQELAGLGATLELACLPVTHINCSLSIPAAHKARNHWICF